VAPIAESVINIDQDFSHWAAIQESVPSLEIEVEAELVFVNGRYSARLSRVAKARGVSVEVLSQLYDDCVENGWNHERRERLAGFRQHLESSDADRETVFAGINTSLMQDAVLIHFDRNAAIRKPVVITHIVNSIAGNLEKSLPVVTPRVFASLDKRAEAVILERYLAQGTGRFLTNSVTDLRIGEGAKLSYARLQNESTAKDSLHVATTRVRQGRDSSSELFQFSLGAATSRQDLHVSLEGEGAEAVVDGLYMVQGEQHVDNHTVIEHVVGNTRSEQLYKGILSDHSRAVFNGKIHIHQNAQKANSAQLNNNLVLSPRAEVDTKPELEIYADDVKASHGATIGRLDPDHVFYLETRAIPRNEAIKLLARGFALDVVYHMKAQSLRDALIQAVDAKFEAMHVTELMSESQKEKK
jgi:Fe-S cluster assembly protein SufD